MRVVLAEDDPVIALGIEAKLAELGHETVGRAATGEGAVEQVLSLAPDVVVMDLVMPGVDGLTAARRITEAGMEVPVVAVTAHEEPELVERAIEVGVSAYLMKPLTTAQLRSALELAVCRHREFTALRSEVRSLERALEARKLVERAKGILIDRSQLSEGEAFAAIQRRARSTGRTMADVASEIVRAAELLPPPRRSRA
jgi:AmiR/NasT family two-component response regulator